MKLYLIFNLTCDWQQLIVAKNKKEAIKLASHNNNIKWNVVKEWRISELNHAQVLLGKTNN